MSNRVCNGFLLFLMATGVWHSSRAEDANKEGLLACSKLGDDSERLRCFDDVTQRLLSGAARIQTPVAASATEMFGSRPQTVTPPQPELPREALKSISARVTSFHETQRRLTLVLDNGQTWQQLGTEDLLLRVGDGVKISRGAFDSFILMTPGNRVTHVKRLN